MSSIVAGREPALIWCPFASEADAAGVAGRLLDEQLVACANILPMMRSLFISDGQRGEASETGVLFKTNAALLARAVARIEALHPYDKPAIIGWHAREAPEAARSWLAALTGEASTAA